MSCPVSSSHRTMKVKTFGPVVLHMCIDPACRQAHVQENVQLRRQWEGPKSQTPAIRESAFTIFKPVFCCEAKPPVIPAPKPQYALWGHPIPASALSLQDGQNGKGDTPRPVDPQKYGENYDRIFKPTPKRVTFKPQPKAGVR